MDSDYFGMGIGADDSLLFISNLRFLNRIDNSVYVYQKTNNDYEFVEKIYPSDLPTMANFGSEILYKDRRLFVTAINRKHSNETVGAVYIYEWDENNWVERQILIPPGPYSHHENFGHSLAVKDDLLLVGAIRDVYNDIISGSAYLYKYIQGEYVLIHQFIPFDAKEDQNFGSSVLLTNDLIIIGSLVDSTASGSGSGSIYVYERDDTTWSFFKKYIPEQNSENLAYGVSLAENGEFVFVGSPILFSFDKPGRVYIYQYNGLSLEFSQIITSNENYTNDRFGFELDACGDSLLVGAVFDTVKGSYSGSAYLFTYEDETWGKKSKIVPSNEEEADDFGRALLVDKDKIIISAPGSNVGEIDPGIVYIYTSKPLSVDNSEMGTEQFHISNNYPNPFNSSTKLSYSIKESGIVSLKVFNVVGEKVANLVNEVKNPGSYSVVFNASSLASGIYFYTLRTNNFVETKKMILMK